MSISVSIVDDHELVRQGISLILGQTKDVSLIHECSSVDLVLPLLKQVCCDVLLMDISMPGVTGLDGIEIIKQVYPELPILMLTMHDESQYGVRAMQLGASGYLTKDNAPAELLKAIRSVVSGKKYISSEFSEMIAMTMFGDATMILHDRLSKREFDVLLLLAKGVSPTDISQQLDLSIKTVSTYRTRILDKLHLTNNVDLVRYCLDHQLIV